MTKPEIDRISKAVDPVAELLKIGYDADADARETRAQLRKDEHRFLLWYLVIALIVVFLILLNR